MYLNTHTYYSLRYGTMKPETLLKQARDKGYDCLALTDINNTSASLMLVRLAPKYQIRPVLGIDFRNGVQQQFVGIAKNNKGFYELNSFLSKKLHDDEEIPDQAPAFKNAFVVYPFAKYHGQKLRRNEYIGLAPYELNKLKFSEHKSMRHKMLIMHPASFSSKREFNAHRLLRAIDNNTLLSKLPKSEEANEKQVMLPKAELLEAYAEWPELIKNTELVFEQCSIAFEFGADQEPKNQKTFTGSTEKDNQLIRFLCKKGLSYRYPVVTDKITKRIELELEIIEQKGFTSYFLINWDILRYAREKGYFYIGRGSGANSIVAYLLRITDVDPVELDLYFERFINLYRKNPPDFDIDFSWHDRDDVTKYIFRRFPHVALLATYNTFQYKAVIRELGKVFGLPPHEIDQLGQGQFEFDKLDQLSQLVLKYSTLIHDFPSHLSIHAGGILITEKPVEYYTATFMPPKGFPTTQFDMIIAEDAGLFKFDILSQRGLAKIRESLDIIKANKPKDEPIDIHDIKRFKQDERVKDLLRNAKAMGCFYVESPAMRMLLKKLEVDHYLGLVAASSIIRPGVARSGMMREYIMRFKDPERRKTAHPVMADIMPETYGVMVYQEDVIKVAHYFAGLDLSEADVLRRGMSGKFRAREEFNKVKEKFFSNCQQKGYADKLTKEIWNQIESFAGYAFAKGHSASYAVESYQCLFLKAYYPLEYMVAVINNFGGFYRTEYYVHEARMWGGNIHAPCVNRSFKQTVIYGKDIYLGFMLLQEIEGESMLKIERARQQGGCFQSFDDFIDRVGISIEQVSILIKINAFRFTGIGKQELLWKAHFRLAKSEPKPDQYSLFPVENKEFKIPELSATIYEEAFDQIELLGFPLVNPFILIENSPVISFLAADLPRFLNQNITIWGYLVTYKVTSTVKKERMCFGTFIDTQGSFFDTTHFPQTLVQFPFRGKGVYAIHGKVVEEFGFYSIEVIAMRKEAVMEDPRYSDKPLSEHKEYVDKAFRGLVLN